MQAPAPRPSAVPLLVLATASFLVFGALIVLIGSTQAARASALGLELAGTGALASALYLGLSLGSVGIGRFVDRRGPRDGWYVAALCSAAGAGGAALADGFVPMLVALFVLGVGAGALETSLNTAIFHADPERATPRLGATHAAAMASAVLAAPGFGALAEGPAGAAGADAVMAAAFVALVVLALVLPVAWPGASPSAASRTALSAILPFALMSLAYVGFETLFTTFAVPWADGRGAAPDEGVRAISAFYLGLLASRVGYAVVARPRAEIVLCVGGLAAGSLVVATLAAPGMPLVPVGFALGIGLGPTFPVLIALAGARFPTRVGAVTGAIVAIGGVGGWVAPAIAGTAGDALGVSAVFVIAALLSLGVALPALALLRRGH